MKSFRYRQVLAAVGVAGLIALGPAAAEDVRLLPSGLGLSEWYGSRAGLGLAGLDPVSFWFPGGPALGAEAHALEWNGLAWHFATAANRSAFLRDPEAFLPRFGGFDAAALAAGRLADADPRVFLVRERRLYLFRDPASRARFQEDDAAIHRAETAWPAFRAGLVGG